MYAVRPAPAVCGCPKARACSASPPPPAAAAAPNPASDPLCRQATTRISLGLQQPFSLACATAGSDATLWMVSTGTTVFDEDEFSPGPPAQIRQYSADGRLLQAFGSFGEGPGQLKFPQSLAAVPAGSGLRIVVAGAQALQRWQLAG